MITPNTAQNILMVGTGYVGLTTAVGLAKLGHTVTCYDINEQRVKQLRDGISPYYEPDLTELLVEGTQAEKLTFFDKLEQAYAGQRYVFVAVQTPTDENGKSDLSALIAAVKNISQTITAPTLVIIKSTVPVGAFEHLQSLFADKQDLMQLVSCPEFLAEGSAVKNFFNPTRTIVGSDSEVISEEVAGLFHGLGGYYITTDAKTAQMIKYTANAFLATRVAFINDIAELCEKFGINANDVSSALPMDPRLGGSHTMPGMSFAGPCLPKDILALIETSEQRGVPALLLRGASDHNIAHLRHIIDTIVSLTTEGATIAVFGLSFKANTDDVRNAFSLKIIKTLVEECDMQIRATDPHSIPAAQMVFTSPALTFVDDPLEAAKGSDLQLFLTPWDEYKQLDFTQLASTVKQKNIYDTMQMIDEPSVRSAGFAYHAIGRMYGEAGAPAFTVSENPQVTKV